MACCPVPMRSQAKEYAGPAQGPIVSQLVDNAVNTNRRAAHQRVLPMGNSFPVAEEMGGESYRKPSKRASPKWREAVVRVVEGVQGDACLEVPALPHFFGGINSKRTSRPSPRT